MVEEEEDEVEFIPSSFGLEASVSEGVHTSRPQLPTHPLTSTTSTHQRKKAKKDALAEAITGIEASLSEFVASKKKQDRPKPTGEEILEEVLKVNELTQFEIFEAMQKLMKETSEQFHLLKSIDHDEKKKGWIKFLIRRP